MRVIALLVGLMLLFPGVCAFCFMIIGISVLPPLGSGEWRDSSIWGIILVATLGWGFCYLISFGGIMMMLAALKPRTPAEPVSRTSRPPRPDPLLTSSA